MPNDTEFTLSLFDNTALSSWILHPESRRGAGRGR